MRWDKKIRDGVETARTLEDLAPILQVVHPIEASIMLSDLHVQLLKRESLLNRASRDRQEDAYRVVDHSVL
jgi:hypothetical protein